MDASKTKTQSTYFNINELVRLSECANTLQHRLLASSQIIRYIASEEYSDGHHQWVIDTTNWKVSKSEERVMLSEEMYNTLKVFTPTVNDNGDEILNTDLDEKRQLIAVITYMVCFRSNPYLGRRFYDKVVISHDWEKKYWGANRVFSFSDDRINWPDGYYQSKTLEFWESLKQTELTYVLRKYFSTESQIEADNIIATLFNMMSKLKTGPQSGIRMYLTDNCTSTSFLLTDKKYFLDPSLNIIGYALQKTENGRPDLYLLNLSGSIWEVTTASGRKIDIYPGKDMPVRSKMVISIPKEGICWSVE